MLCSSPLLVFRTQCVTLPHFVSIYRAESVDECSERQVRLGAIRSLFHQLYFKAVGYTTKYEAGNSFSSILDQVTEKLREGWGTVV